MRKLLATALASFILAAPGSVSAHPEDCPCGPGPDTVQYSAEPVVWWGPQPGIYPVLWRMQEDTDRMLLEMDRRMQETFYTIAQTNPDYWRQDGNSRPLLAGVPVVAAPRDYVVTVNVAGFSEDELVVETDANNRTLTVRAEKERIQTNGEEGTYTSIGSFTQVLTLPGDADPRRIMKIYKNGQLTITVPRKPPLRGGAV